MLVDFYQKSKITKALKVFWFLRIKSFWAKVSGMPEIILAHTCILFSIVLVTFPRGPFLKFSRFIKQNKALLINNENISYLRRHEKTLNIKYF